MTVAAQYTAVSASPFLSRDSYGAVLRLIHIYSPALNIRNNFDSGSK
jgi:hypothetical protein